MMALPTTTKIGVIGAGTMGAGIAQVAAKAGHTVFLYDVAEGAAQKGIDQTAVSLQTLVDRARMSLDEKESLILRLHPVVELEDFKECGLVIEVIVENVDVKKGLFARLEDICSDDTILATNTSSISVTAIGAGLRKPERLVGMHFFNPAPIMKLVEVVSGLATDTDIAEQIHATATAWGKHAVYAKSTAGFIVNRVARPFYAESLRILQEGASDIATIDAVMREAGGFKMGAFELMDLIGHDVNFAVTNSVYDAYFKDQRFLPSLIQQELVQAGRLGRKSKIGFYDYRDDATAVTPQTEDVCKMSVDKVVVRGNLKPIAPLIRLLQGSELQVELYDIAELDAVLEVGQAKLMLCDGRFATVRCKQDNIENLIHFDLALDYASCSRIALCKADQSSDAALKDVISFFQVLGKKVSVIEDVAGMIVMRTVAMLVNEGSDAVYQQVCTVKDVDIAMKGGVNYPKGPMEWADHISLDVVTQTLKGLAQSYGEDRYRLSPLLLKAQASSSTLLNYK